MDRSEQVDRVSSELLPRVALLTRLLGRQLEWPLSRTELGVLATLETGPKRITELAELEGLAQPTMTIVIQQLEQRGLVARGRDSEDGRVVLVRRTESGATALADLRAQASAALRPYVAAMADEQLEALAMAMEALQALIPLLQGGASS